MHAAGGAGPRPWRVPGDPAVQALGFQSDEQAPGGDTERQRVHYMDPHATSRGAVPRSWSEADFWGSPLWMMATAVPRRGAR